MGRVDRFRFCVCGEVAPRLSTLALYTPYFGTERDAPRVSSHVRSLSLTLWTLFILLLGWHPTVSTP